MSLLNKCIAIVGAVALTVLPAVAQDEKSMSMISVMQLDPSKAKQFDDAWGNIREIAMENGYPYAELAGGWRNERWILTPIKNYAEVDAVFAAREAVSDAGGKKYKKAIANFVGAMVDSITFFTVGDPELSYTPDGAPQGNFMEIDTFRFRYGAEDEMKSILVDYKALMEGKAVPYGYQVSWDGIGSQGNSVTIVTYAQNAVAMAEANAAIEAMLDGDDEADAIFERYTNIATGSETIHSLFDPDASMNMPTGE
ncbi:MAG: hypothetical protein GXP06_14550 [Alphaproteobacteria bacterium]|nr:hypothetical protein [Alphaproteobacteria bacterium]